MVEQSAEWCQQRKAPVVSIASPGKPTETEANKLLQLQLMALGFDPGGIDGVVGTGTSNAIRQFQRSTGQTVDGVITPTLKAQLDERTRSRPAATSAPKSDPDPGSGAVNTGDFAVKPTPSDQEKRQAEKQPDFHHDGTHRLLAGDPGSDRLAAVQGRPISWLLAAPA